MSGFVFTCIYSRIRLVGFNNSSSEHSIYEFICLYSYSSYTSALKIVPSSHLLGAMLSHANLLISPNLRGNPKHFILHIYSFPPFDFLAQVLERTVCTHSVSSWFLLHLRVRRLPSPPLVSVTTLNPQTAARNGYSI